MKVAALFKPMLLSASACVLLQGCGGNLDFESRDISDGEREYIKMQRDTAKKEKIESQILSNTPLLNYMFAGDFKKATSFPGYATCGARAYTEYGGKYSDSFKRTLKSLISNLNKVGFSGFAEEDLKDKFVYFTNNGVGGCNPNLPDGSLVPRRFLKQPNKNAREFVLDVVDYMLGFKEGYHEFYAKELNDLKYVGTLVGFKYKGKDVMLVRNNTNERPTLVLHTPVGREVSEEHYLPLLDAATDTEVTGAQIAEWNQIFVDTFKDDAELMAALGKDNSRAADIVSGLSDITSSVLLTPKTDGGVDASALRVNGDLGMRTAAFNLPMSIEVLGDVRSNAVNQLLVGRSTYVFSNGVYMGGVHAYEQTALSTQNEHSVAMGYMGSNVLLEAQAGYVNNNNTVFNLSNTGARYQLMGAYTLTEGVTPFVQSVYQDFTDAASKIKSYVGVQLNKEVLVNADTSISLQASAKLGVGSQSYGDNSLQLTAKLSHLGFYFFDTSLEITPKDAKVLCGFRGEF